MAVRYALTCSCGKVHPVEISKAGGSLTCSCGCELTLPTMLKMKKLPLWQEEGGQEAPSQKAPNVPPGNFSSIPSSDGPPPKETTVRVLAGNRLGVFIVGLLLTLLFGYTTLVLWQHRPHLTEVFAKQTLFADGDKYVRRNSSPITDNDYDFFLHYDQTSDQTFIINDFFIDHGMTPFIAFVYFDALKDGLELSENFNENYEGLFHAWQIKKWTSLIVLMLAVCLCAVPWFMPRKKKVVGLTRGVQWTK